MKGIPESGLMEEVTKKYLDYVEQKRSRLERYRTLNRQNVFQKLSCSNLIITHGWSGTVLYSI
jgi:hypothetical protein